MDSPPISPQPLAAAAGARRIEIRPRANDVLAPAASPIPEQADVPLSFSCPACHQMLSTPARIASIAVVCPECQAEVMPPQIVRSATARAERSHIPPPKKTGQHTLRR
jgi:hypothetical protein